MKMILKKGQTEVGMGRFLIMILVLLVVATVLMFFFKSDLNRYLRNIIPDFSPASEDEVDLSSNSPCGEDFYVGTIDSDSGQISFCSSYDSDCGSLQASKLYWKAGKTNAEIGIKSISYINAPVPTDPVERFESIGEYDGKTFVLLNEILSQEGDFYNSISSSLPSDLILVNLNGSYKNNLNICRKEKIEVSLVDSTFEKILTSFGSSLSLKSSYFSKSHYEFVLSNLFYEEKDFVESIRTKRMFSKDGNLIVYDLDSDKYPLMLILPSGEIWMGEVFYSSFADKSAIQINKSSYYYITSISQMIPFSDGNLGFHNGAYDGSDRLTRFKFYKSNVWISSSEFTKLFEAIK